MTLTLAQLQSLPLYLDGSDGSMWPVNDNAAHWELCVSEPAAASRRFVRLSDLLAALEDGPFGDSPIASPVEIPVDRPSDGATLAP